MQIELMCFRVFPDCQEVVAKLKDLAKKMMTMTTNMMAMKMTKNSRMYLMQYYLALDIKFHFFTEKL